MSDCPAPGCGNGVKPGQLACAPHWFQLPGRLRGRVWRAWDRIRDGDGSAFAEHDAAKADAIEFWEQKR